MSKSKLQELQQGHCILITVLSNTFPYLSGPSHLGRCAPKGTSAMMERDIFQLAELGVCYCHLVATAQECYIERVAYGAQDLPDEKNVIK